MIFERSGPSSGVDVAGASIVVVSSGYADGPTQPFCRWLVKRGAYKVVTITHPLLAEERGEHRVDVAIGGSDQHPRVTRLPHRPPFTYGLDPLVPLRPPRADAWIGFNCLATGQGLIQRRLGRVGHVVHWNVDFVPERFGAGLLTRVYDRLDAWCCRRADGRVELSEAARVGRTERYGLADAAPVEVVPMGAWVDDAPTTNVERLADRRIVFLGHLVDRMGPAVFVEALTILRDRGVVAPADIVGGGPLLEDTRRAVHEKGLDGSVLVHGFIDDFDDVRQLLAGAAIAVAPYDTATSSFSRFADPGKLKAYLGAGLPILLTAVPPNAAELEAVGGAEIVQWDPTAFADRIALLLSDQTEWVRRHNDALAYARRFDWTTLFDEHLPRLGLRI